ncbi:MAG TPA: energy transducer TonB [Candidatus Methylomirabilis sp.]|nr:energy transducer TonB [Candidatus Methylomirabilis sp.]
METARFRDDPWRRLPWVAPVALALTVASQMAFLSLLHQPATNTPVPLPVDVQVVEVPAQLPEPPKPPARKPETLPRPRPTPPPPQPKPETPPTPPPPVRREPEVTRQPEPAPPTVPDLPKDVSSPAPPSTSSAPSPLVTPGPMGPAPSTTRRTAPGPDAAVAPQAPVSRAPDGTGLGGGKMGARAIYKPLPEIPDALRHRNIEAVAIARFQVAANGSAQVELVEPTSDPDLNRALVDSLKRWRFFPGMEDGKPVASTVDIRIPISVR